MSPGKKSDTKQYERGPCCISSVKGGLVLWTLPEGRMLYICIVAVQQGRLSFSFASSIFLTMILYVENESEGIFVL